MKKYKYVIFQLIIILFIVNLLYSKNIPYKKNFKSIYSRYFTVLYHIDKDKALRVLRIAEEVHNKLANKFSVKDIHTYIILVDSTDLANGLTTILPDNIIIIYDSVPLSYTGISILNYYDWIHQLIVHEYTHILTLNQANFLFNGLQTSGFKYLAPNMLLPISSLEGLAVCMETVYTPMGRARSSYKEMVLRVAVNEDTVPEIDEISTFLNKIPYGDGPYIWGGAFHYYLINKISEESLLKSYKGNAECCFALPTCFDSGFCSCMFSTLSCFPLNSYVKYYSGTSYYDHYYNWTYFIKKKYNKEIFSIKDPTQSFLLYDFEDFWSIYDIVIDKGDIYFSGYSPDHGYGLYKYNVKEEEIDIIIEDRYITSLTLFKGDLFFTGMKVVDNEYNFFILYRYNIMNEECTSIDKMMRVLEVASSDDYLYALVRKDSFKYLYHINNDCDIVSEIIKFSKDSLVSDISFADNDEFYFIYKDETGFIDIYKYKINEKKRIRITENPAIELSLFYSDNKLFYISDYNSRFNLYEYNIKKKKFLQQTDYISGILCFAEYDNSFYASYYKSSGYSMTKIDKSEFKNYTISYNNQTNIKSYEKISLKEDISSENIYEDNFSTFNNLFSYYPGKRNVKTDIARLFLNRF